MFVILTPGKVAVLFSDAITGSLLPVLPGCHAPGSGRIPRNFILVSVVTG